MTARNFVDGRENVKQKAILSKMRKKWTIVAIWTNAPTAKEERQHPNTEETGRKKKHNTQADIHTNTWLNVHKRHRQRQGCVAAPKTSFIWHCIKNVWLWFSYNVCHITKWQVFQLSNNDLFANSILLKKRRQADVKWIKHWMEGLWRFYFNLPFSLVLSLSLPEKVSKKTCVQLG